MDCRVSVVQHSCKTKLTRGCGYTSAMCGSGGSSDYADSGAAGRTAVPPVVVAGTAGSLSKLSKKMVSNCAFFIDDGKFKPLDAIFCRRATADQFNLHPSGCLPPWIGEGVADLDIRQCHLPLSTSPVARVAVSRRRRSVGLYR